MTKREFENEPSWMNDAACRGQSEDFYPSEEKEGVTERIERQARAKELCGRCTVRSECLEFALLSNEKYGIWGGLTERERLRVRKQIRLEASA